MYDRLRYHKEDVKYYRGSTPPKRIIRKGYQFVLYIEGIKIFHLQINFFHLMRIVSQNKRKLSFRKLFGNV